MALSDRMLVMNLGVVQQVDTPMNIYNNPVNKFVFSFIGLSNFIPVEISEGKAYVEGAADCGSLTREIPASVRDEKMTLACRPSEIELAVGEGLKGVVKRKVYLGDIIDYRVGVGNVEIRVQKNRRRSGFNEGDPCTLKFNRLLWYKREEF
jgi:iron(III) transport system ATP-binding protein